MEDFTPYELAVKLKEKGFRELCTHFYRNGNLIPQEMFCGVRNNTHPKLLFNSMEVKLKDTNEQVQVNIVDAPTISQVLKWLREKKDVVVSVNPYYGKLVNVHWWWDIRTPVYKVEICSNIKQEGFDSYELAALAGIEYVIDNDLI